MNKSDVLKEAARTGRPYMVLVSPAHGAVLPAQFTAIQRLDLGAAQPTPALVEFTAEGFTTDLLFSGSIFHCVVPWTALHVVATEDWVVSWPLLGVAAAAPEHKPGLRLVKEGT